MMLQFPCSLRWTLTAVLMIGMLIALDPRSTADETRLIADISKTPLIPRKVLFDNPDKSQARISPDGKHLAFLAPVDGVLNVWVGPIDKPQDAKAITKDEKRGIRAYFWTFTNDRILYVQDAEGDEN